MKPIVVCTPNAPAAIGPYSQAVKVAGLLFSAGQIGLDPETMELVADDVRGQAMGALDNLEAILAAGGSDLSRVVKTTIFLVDMSDFAIVNEVYAHRFGETRPARSTVAVRALPKGALVEIEAVAQVG